MAFTFTLDSAAADARLAAMINKLQKLPIADELMAWEREDMHRRYPKVEDVTPTSATTIIPRRGRRRRVVTRTARAQHRKSSRPIIKSKRPILRPELFDKLRARMSAMLQRELKW